MAERLTIDNLGNKVSEQYAENQKQLQDFPILKDARAIRFPEVDVTAPAFSSELDQLLQMGPANTPWAIFEPPARYQELKRAVFTYQLLPILGSADKLQALIDRVNALPESPEKSVFLELFNILSFYGKISSDIYARIHQYKKG